MEGCIEVGVFNVDMSKFEVVKHCQTKDGTDGVPLGNWSKCECEAFDDKSFFKAGDLSTLVMFDVERPFTLDGLLA